MKIIAITSVVFFSVSLITYKCVARDVKVYRWYNSLDNEYVVGTEGEYAPYEQIWKEKTFLFTAYDKPGKGRIAVYGWWNPLTKDHANINEGEYTDEQMTKMGYTQKHLKYYTQLCKPSKNYKR